MEHPPRNIDLTCFKWEKFILKTSLPSNAKYLALYLGTYMNADQDMAWPSLKRIEHETGLSHPTVLKHLKLLSKEGWLIKTSGNRTTSNRYVIGFPEEVGKSVTYMQEEVGKPVTHGRYASYLQVGKPVTSNNNRITSNNNKGGGSTRKRTIQEDLTDTSWAD